MTIHLIRHAAAGSRKRWNGDDLDRPLDDRGRAQAEAIAARLADATLRAVWSSIAVRCVETVGPLATEAGLDVETKRVLTEGARPTDLVELLRTAAAEAGEDDGDMVLCSHGDLIPEVLNRLVRDEMTVVGPRGCKKASIWSLETEGDRIVKGIYLEAP